MKFNVFEINGPVGSPASKTEVKLSTSEKSKSIKETISSIFGSKFLGGLCPFYVNLSDVVKKHSMDTSNTDIGCHDEMNTWRIEGLISKAPFLTSGGGKGNISRDIQIFCMNGRPVDMPKFSRVITDVWRAYESSLGSESSKKRPACIVGIYLPNDMFDVNLSADKRQIMMNNEDGIYEQLRVELNKLWSQQTQGQFIVNEADTSTKDSGTAKRRDDDSGKASVKRMRDDEDKGDTIKEFKPGPNKKKNLGKIKMKRRNAFVNSFDNIGEATTDYSLEHPQKIQFRSSNIEDLPHEICTQAKESMDENENESGTTGPQKFHQEQKSPYKGDPMMTEDEVVRRLSISCSLGNESKDDTVAERVKWDETKLQFNKPKAGSLNSLREEINTLKAMERDKINGTLSANESKDNISKVRSERFPSRHLHLQSAQSKDLSLKSIEALKQFSFSSSKVTGSIRKKGMKSIRDFDGQSPSSSGSITLKAFSTNPVAQCELKSRLGRNSADSMEEFDDDISKSDASLRSNDASTNSQVTKCNLNSGIESNSVDSMEKFDDDLSTVDVSSKRYTEESKQTKPSISTLKTKEIKWESFQSTEDVILQAKQAYIDRQSKKSQVETMQLKRDEARGTSEQELLLDDSLPNHNEKKISLTREAFLKMQIIGQFNLGFILAVCDMGHLWVSRFQSLFRLGF